MSPPSADEVFLAALEKPRAQWTAFVEGACGEDDALRRSVFSLLRAHEQTGPFDRLGRRLSGLMNQGTGEMTGHATAATSTPRLAPGATLGRYEIRERLGAGGMGEAFRAFDSRLHREVAIKVIARRVQDRPEILERFEEEARAASALNHPNIVAVFDIGEEDDFPYIVMELVDGQNLRDHLGDQPLPVDRIVRLGSQLAGALATVHERGVVHRDLKPENVVVTSQGVAKILDFGVAQFQPVGAEIESLPTLGSEGIVGTVGYMAPEALTGRPVDHRADQFALGAMLYEMATGRSCFRRSNVAETVAATLREDPEPLAEARPELPPSLVRLVERCLSKDPSSRYASTWALHKALSTMAVASGTQGRPSRAPLPSLPTTLIGRQDELHQIQNLVLESRVRLLTVTGTGGCGKTRLAIQAARELEPSFPGGVAFVSLAAISDPDLVGPSMARAAGGVEATSGRDLPDLFVELAADRGPVLVVLDNFEQVVEASPVVGELLAGCPDLTILVTSRELLRLQAEHELPLQPLGLPPPGALPPVEELERSPAVALFVQRARWADPGFALTPDNAAAVAELCTRLDGLPLALELAAGRARTLTPAAMLERLESRLKLLTGGPRDMPDRQRTLRQTIDWSHDLLEAEERVVFRRLAVFPCDFTLEAAQAVSDPFGHLERDVEDVVESLFAKSLLVRLKETGVESRFLLLETVREYALEQLAASDDGPLAHQSHAAYFRVLAEEAEATVRHTALGPEWMERFTHERDSFRAALDWLVAEDKAEWGLKIASGLFTVWLRGEDVSEGRRRVHQLLALPSAQGPSAERGVGLQVAAALAGLQEEHEEAVAFYQQADEIYRHLGNRRAQAGILNDMAVHLPPLGRLEEARACFEECLEAWRELGEDGAYGRTLANYAHLFRREGNLERAGQLYREAAEMFERAGDRVGASWEASHQGDVALERGDPAAAAVFYREALDAFRDLGDTIGAGRALADLGHAARTERDLSRAEEYYVEALEALRTVGHRSGITSVLEGLAVIAEGLGRPGRALLLAAAASLERERLKGRASEELTKALKGAVERARSELDEKAAEANWRRGSRLSFNQAVDLASGTEPQAEA